MTYVVFFVTIFIAATGTAMSKRVYRRAESIAAGKDLPERSLAYKRTGTALTAIGLVGLTAWFVVFIFGNPMAFFATL